MVLLGQFVAGGPGVGGGQDHIIERSNVARPLPPALPPHSRNNWRTITSVLRLVFSHLLLSCLQGQNFTWFRPATPWMLIQTPLRKRINLKACLQGSKKQTNCSQGFWKTTFMKHFVLLYVLYENLLSGAPGVHISIYKSTQQMTWQQAWKKLTSQASVPKKLLK